MTNNRKVITGMVRFSYPALFKPRGFNGADEKYSLSIIIPKDDKETIKKIEDAIEAAKTEGMAKWGGRVPTNLRIPLRDGDIDRPDDPAYEDAYFVNASSKQKPRVVDGLVKDVVDESQVYGGCYGRVSLIFYPYAVSGNKGVGCELLNVQKLRDGEPLGSRSRPQDDFEIDQQASDELNSVLGL